MKQFFTLMLSLLMVAVIANPVDKKTAEQVAVNYYTHYAPATITDYSVNSQFESQLDGVTTYYTFSFNAGGFVMVAADDASIPVLGYSHEGNFDGELNPSAKAWFDGYSNEISSIASSRMSNAETRVKWDNILNNNMEREIMDVTPLITTTWDQGCYYNALCPVEPGAGYGSCGRAWTGCVATTMAVIMKYHQWPVNGIGYHTYTHPTYGEQTADFSSVTYDYAAMPNKVTSANAAVATLMYHCGVSVNMNYAADGSGAFSEDVPFAMINYFNYAPSTEMKAKDNYPVMADWYALLRTELDASRPLYYAGSSSASGGHAWICDGYRLSDDKFHFDWGWSGSANGYFAIGGLNPAGNNFNDNNRVIVGVVPGDNATSWIVQNTHFAEPSRGISFMHAVSPTVAWAIAYDGSGAGAYINEVVKTADGGAHWTPGQVLGGNDYGLGNICGVSENVAYVSLYNKATQNNTCGIYKTSDGGTTWVQLPGALQGSGSFANNVYFWNEQEGMCHGDVKDGYFEIYTTSNGGTTWTRVPQTSITGTVLSGEGGWTSCITTAGDNSVMFGTNKGNVYISDDRGLTWRVTSTGIMPASNGGINAIAFKDEMNGIAAQTQVPLQYRSTSDGGATWVPFTPTGAIFTNDIMYVPGTENTYVSTGAAAGQTGISYSHDGGSTWTIFPTTSDFQFLAGDFYDNTCGYVGSFNQDQYYGGMFRMLGELAPGVLGAQIEVTPVAITATVTEDEVVTLPLTISNTGDAELTWNLVVDPATATWLSADVTSGTVAMGESTDLIITLDATALTGGPFNANLLINNNSTSNPVVTVPVQLNIYSGDLEAPKNLVAAVMNQNDVKLTWEAPGGGTGSIEELIYDNGVATGAYSYNGATMAIHMSPQGPCKVLRLKYYTTWGSGSKAFNAEVYGWNESTSMPSTTQLYTTPAEVVEDNWMEVDISAANLMVNGDFVVGFGSINDSSYLGFDAALNNGRIWDLDGGAWASWTEAYLIRAIVEYTDGSMHELSAVPAPSVSMPAITNLVAKSSHSSLNTMEPIAAKNHASRALTGYNVYRDGSKINSAVVSGLTYTDMDLTEGTYAYYVTAVYDEGESGPSNTKEVTIVDGGATTSIILDFEDLEDFSLTFGDWTAIDVDGSPTYGFDGITFPHSGEPMSFIAFNPLATTPPVGAMTPHGGERFGASFASGTPPNNDYMISPKTMLGQNAELTLWVKSYTAQYGLEKYNIRVSTTNTNPSSFTTIAGPIEAPATEWTFVTYDLSAYEGQEVYVAIQCVSNDAFVFMIDDVAISFTSSVKNPEVASFNVYPNPTNGELNITGNERIERVRMVNLAGQVILESVVGNNSFRFDTGNVPAGLYLLNIVTEKGTVTRKISVK
ncbi:MAG: C10 family peptidase [Lentimicrobium sp.]|nr:C10 family peptidase [Lentimicrobium sp.]